VTIAISLKVHEGVVLASDSASTVFGKGPDDQPPFVINVYNNANKIFNLLKGAPIGASSWGAGAIGQASIPTLMKDLRRRFSGLDEQYPEWKIDPRAYAIDQVARRVREFIFDEHYKAYFAEWPQKPDLGMFVVGYSSKSSLAEEYQITISNGECGDPQLLRPPDAAGMTWNGQIEAISRLLLGFSPALLDIMVNNLDLPEEKKIAAQQILPALLNAQLIQESMPLQDAIDLAGFLADVAVKYSQFAPGASVVGGPIEIAAISKHEGFKWVTRKHYYDPRFNPPLPPAEAEMARLTGATSEPVITPTESKTPARKSIRRPPSPPRASTTRANSTKKSGPRNAQ
jgi:hypothetical protein